MIAGVLAEIRTEFFTMRSLQRYRYMNLFDTSLMKEVLREVPPLMLGRQVPL
jgi:hypothetical protein